MLSDTKLAKLANTLQVPLIVKDIIDGQATLSPDAQYGMHEVLSNYQPDSALLCIALSVRTIAKHYQYTSTNMAIMRNECDRIITEYGGLWLKNAEDKCLDDNLVFDTLEQIPEDLEALAELIEINIGQLREDNGDLAGVAEIMAVQARTQTLIADTFIDMMDQENDAAIEAPIYAYNDNVIPFPGMIAGA